MKRVGNLLKPSKDKGLGEIIEHARDMGVLSQALKASLTTDAADAIVAANVRIDGTLVILASSSAWAARLRFETDALIKAAQDTGADVQTCSVRVNRDNL